MKAQYLKPPKWRMVNSGGPAKLPRHHVAHKWRRQTKLNDEMQEIRTFIRSRRAVWRKMCKDGTGLVVSPLWWDERRRWLDEMSFIKARGGKR